MRSRFLLSGILFFSSVVFSVPVTHAVELARIGNDVVTSEGFIEDWRYAAPTREAPARTLEGKKEFLDRIIAKRLLSQYFRGKGWDTLTTWNSVLDEYEKSIYLQALYQDAIPEARHPGTLDGMALWRLGKKFVDSLTVAYAVHPEEKTINLIADKSVGLLKTDTVHRDREGKPVFRWSGLFTDEEKKLPAATFTGGVLTVGELATGIDGLPSFARPTAGNSDEILQAIEHFGNERIFKFEFDKRHLSEQPYFRERMTNKREEFIADGLFSAITDSSVVSKEDVEQYYDKHRDDFVTLTLVNMAVITLQSEDKANEVAKKIAGGEGFESVAVNYSIYTSSATGFDTTGLIDRSQFPAVYDGIWDKKIGEVVGPVYASDRDSWIVAKLLGREDPRLLSLEEATPMVVERLKLVKADEAVVKLIAELRSKTVIKVDYEALEKLELPPEAGKP